MKRFTVLLLTAVLAISSFVTVMSYADDDEGYDFPTNYDEEYYGRFRGQGMSVNVYNWALYLADGTEGLMDVNKEFEKLTGIKVYYTNFATNEEMYAKLQSGGASYDVVLPSDYMVGRMIAENMLAPINYANIPNSRYIDDRFYDNVYDPGNIYSVPFAWNLVGLIYNTKMVDEVPTSWDVLWDEKYKGKILMFGNSRDTFAIALSKLGYSMNTEDPDELKAAGDLLKEQRPLVQAYVQDQLFDKMEANEAALAPYYAGDALLIDNDDIEIIYPEDVVTNYFMDAVCIMKDAPNMEAAEMYINFLNEPNVAAENMIYISYSTPNIAGMELLAEAGELHELNYPSDEVLARTEQFVHMSEETNLLLDQLWTELLSDSASGGKFPYWILAVVVIAAIGVFQVVSRKNKQKKEEMMRD